MQRRSQPSPSPSSEDAEKGRCCGMENWGVTASEIGHLAVVGAGELGIQHQLSSNGTVRTKLRQKSTPGVGVIHQRLTSCVPPTHSWLPTWAPSCYLIMLRWIDLATIVNSGRFPYSPDSHGSVEYLIWTPTSLNFMSRLTDVTAISAWQ